MERFSKERYEDANLPAGKPKTMENFIPEPGLAEAFQTMRDFIARYDPRVVLLVGNTGTGKSHLAEAAAREFLGQGKSVRYELVPDLLDALKATFQEVSIETTESVLQRAHRAHLLILDDLGMEKGTDWTGERLTSLVDKRVRMGRRLIVTTNKTYEEMKANPHYFRVASRLWGQETGVVKVVVLATTDKRIAAMRL